jgi:hypothetical protein
MRRLDRSTRVEAVSVQTRGMEDIALAESPTDIAYVRSTFVTLEELARGRPEGAERIRAWAGSRMPRATYALAGGELRYAADWWRLLDDAGSIDGVQPLFERRLRAAGGPADAWDAYVGGIYGACLRDVTPENMAVKAQLVATLEAALAEPRPGDPAWCAALRAGVEALDGLNKPFAACDRVRFGPTSRDRLIDRARRDYRHAFAG